MELFYERALGDYPFVWLRIACTECDRYGCYRLTGLVARYGCQITLFDLLDQLVTDCWRWHWQVGDPGEPCGVMFIDQEGDKPGTPPVARLRP